MWRGPNGDEEAVMGPAGQAAPGFGSGGLCWGAQQHPLNVHPPTPPTHPPMRHSSSRTHSTTQLTYTCSLRNTHPPTHELCFWHSLLPLPPVVGSQLTGLPRGAT